jgi:hypothetical protein
MDHNPVSIRLTPAQKAWLACAAGSNRRSKSAEIQILLDAAMKAHPLTIHVHECRYEEEAPFFAATVGQLHPFIEHDDREKVVAAARAKAEELGLGRNAIVFDSEILGSRPGGARYVLDTEEHVP